MSKGPYVGVFRQTMGAWIVLGLAWGLVGLGALFWVAGGLATWLTGKGLQGPTLDFDYGERLVTKGPQHVWPETPVLLVVVIFVLLLLAVILPVVIAVLHFQRRRGGSDGQRLGSMAQEKHLEHFTEDGVRHQALALRPAFEEHVREGRVHKEFHLREAGVPLGKLEPGGAELRASWEDVGVAIMAPRSGKTTAIAIPAVLDAPGAAVVTSNKSDVWEATWEIRQKDTGQQAWLFDPQGITHMPQSWWWDPLRGVTSYDAALRLATHFVQEIEQDASGEEAFWVTAAADLLTALFLAAGVKEDGSLYDVYEWLNDPNSTEPVDLLRQPDPPTAASLDARQAMPEGTRESIYEYARTATRCLRNSDIMRWVIPPTIPLKGVDDGSLRSIGLRELYENEIAEVRGQGPQDRAAFDGRLEFDPEDFAVSRQTMYLLSKDGAASAAPLVAALTDRIMVKATRQAERQYRGRLDPPMVVVLDEAANICRIKDLPLLYSHMGSRGIFVLTVLQSRPQARQVWGKEGFETLWSAATVKLIGAGIDDPALANDISQLVGEHDISIRSVSLADGGAFSESVALRKESIMSISDVRAMPKGTAVLLATGAKPASIRLQPWFRGDRADEIRSAIDFARDAMVAAAQPVDERSADDLVQVNLGKEPADDRPPPPDEPTSEVPVIGAIPESAIPEPAAGGATAVATRTRPPATPTGRNVAVVSQDGEQLDGELLGSPPAGDDDPTSTGLPTFAAARRKRVRDTRRKRR